MDGVASFYTPTPFVVVVVTIVVVLLFLLCVVAHKNDCGGLSVHFL
jgi:hypothetical protein